MLMNVVVYDAVALKEFGSAIASVAVTAALMTSANLFVMPWFRDSYTLVEFAF